MEGEKFRTWTQLLWTIGLVAALTWYVIYRWKRRRIYELMSKIKMPPGLPIVGHIFLVLQPPDRAFPVITDYLFKYGPNFAVWLVHIPLYIIAKPEDLEILMQSQDCLSKGYFYEFTKVAVGDGLFTAPLKKWRRNRKIIQPTFNSKILNSFVPIFASTSSICVNEILPKYVGEKNVDWYKVFTATNLDTICQTAMGVNTDAQRRQTPFATHLERGMHAVFFRMLNVFFHPDFIYNFTKSASELKEAVTYVKGFTKKVILNKKKEFQEELETKSIKISEDDVLVKRKVFLELLLELDHKGMKFTDKELMDEVMTFFVGGTDTSAVTTCFFLSMMGMHPEIQEQVYDEVMTVLDPSRTPTMEELNKLELLERCLKETMRIFPPAPLISRKVGKKEMHLTEFTIPAESFLLFPIFYTHRSSNYWDDPLKFDPERFLPEAVAKRHPYTFLPFSGGLRGCVGMRYSYMNLKNLTSMILRRYKISCDYKSVDEIELMNQIVIRPVHGFKFHLEERQ